MVEVHEDTAKNAQRPLHRLSIAHPNPTALTKTQPEEAAQRSPFAAITEPEFGSGSTNEAETGDNRRIT